MHSIVLGLAGIGFVMGGLGGLWVGCCDWLVW